MGRCILARQGSFLASHSAARGSSPCRADAPAVTAGRLSGPGAVAVLKSGSSGKRRFQGSAGGPHLLATASTIRSRPDSFALYSALSACTIS
jgi:hypothetical protein